MNSFLGSSRSVRTAANLGEDGSMIWRMNGNKPAIGEKSVNSSDVIGLDHFGEDGMPR